MTTQLMNTDSSELPLSQPTSVDAHRLGHEQRPGHKQRHAAAMAAARARADARGEPAQPPRPLPLTLNARIVAFLRSRAQGYTRLERAALADSSQNRDQAHVWAERARAVAEAADEIEALLGQVGDSSSQQGAIDG